MLKYAACALLAPAAVLSVFATAAARPVDPRAVLSLSVNSVPYGDVVVYLRGADILAQVSDLKRAGLKGFAGRRETIANEVFVSLASLKPGISFEVDVKRVALVMTAQPSYFATTVLDLEAIKPPKGIQYSHNPSLFINYSFDVHNLEQFSSFDEAGLSLDGKYLLQSNLFRNFDGTLARGLTNIIWDDRPNLRRWTLGDSVAVTTDPIAGEATIGGISLQKNFSLDPYFISFPQQGFAGTLLTPSTVQVYRNGALIKQEMLPPGNFNLQNIPLGAGAGTTQIVIRNALGQVQQVQTPYYLNTQALAPGINEYQYDVGAIRRNFGTTSFQYSGLAYQAFQLHGFTQWFAGGYRFEGENGNLNGGPEFVLSLPIGALGGSAAASYDGRFTGEAARLTYAYLLSPAFSHALTAQNFGAELQVMSPRYTNLSLQALQDRPLYTLTAFGGFAIGPWITLVPEYQYAKSRDVGPSQSVGLTFQVSLPFNSSLFFAVNYASQPGAQGSINLSANLTFSFGERSNVSVMYDHQSGAQSGNGNLAGFQVQRSLPLGPGYGYLLQGASGQQQQRGTADLQDRTSYGFYEADLERRNGQDTSDFTISGGLAALGARVFPTFPIQDGYALIRTPGVSRVDGTLYNQPMGRTDSKGDLLVPNLIPYFGNELGINEQKIPINYEIDSTKESVAPPFRGGAVVTFPVRPTQAVTGKLEVVVAGKAVIPAFGELSVTTAGRTLTSPIGKGGEFYLDSPSPGDHPARVEFARGVCDFTVDIPKAKAPSFNLGTLRCLMPPPSQRHS